MRLAGLLPFGLLLALFSAPLRAQVYLEAEGSVGSAVLGGFLGAYSGLIVGNLSSRHILCPRRPGVQGPCLAPILVGSALGLGAGAYAGAESSHRIKGAYIGAGLGTLTGLVVLAAFFQSEFDKPGTQHLEPLFAAAFIGAAFGAIAGGIIAGDGDSNRAATQLPLGIRLRF